MRHLQRSKAAREHRFWWNAASRNSRKRGSIWRKIYFPRYLTVGRAACVQGDRIRPGRPSALGMRGPYYSPGFRYRCEAIYRDSLGDRGVPHPCPAPPGHLQPRPDGGSGHGAHGDLVDHRGGPAGGDGAGARGGLSPPGHPLPPGSRRPLCEPGHLPVPGRLHHRQGHGAVEPAPADCARHHLPSGDRAPPGGPGGDGCDSSPLPLDLQHGFRHDDDPDCHCPCRGGAGIGPG